LEKLIPLDKHDDTTTSFLFFYNFDGRINAKIYDFNYNDLENPVLRNSIYLPTLGPGLTHSGIYKALLHSHVDFKGKKLPANNLILFDRTNMHHVDLSAYLNKMEKRNYLGQLFTLT
jgi:hypothetical protein